RGDPVASALGGVSSDVGGQLVEVLHDAVAGAHERLLEREQAVDVALVGGADGAAATVRERNDDRVEGHSEHGGVSDLRCQGRAIGCSTAAPRARWGAPWLTGRLSCPSLSQPKAESKKVRSSAMPASWASVATLSPTRSKRRSTSPVGRPSRIRRP